MIFKKSSDLTLIVLSLATIAGYWMLKSKSPLFNPLSDKNIANQAAVSTYQSITGSMGTPGGDLFDVTHENADSTSLAILVDYFNKQGVTDSTKAKALSMGWTQTDVDNAIGSINSQYGLDSLNNLPPML